MGKKVDGKGNEYYDIRNIRITCIGETWDGENSGIRIQAYTGKGNQLHKGAELPIPDKETAYDLISAIIAVFNLKKE